MYRHVNVDGNVHASSRTSLEFTGSPKVPAGLPRYGSEEFNVLLAQQDREFLNISNKHTPASSHTLPLTLANNITPSQSTLQYHGSDDWTMRHHNFADVDHCCSLLNSIWKYSSTQLHEEHQVRQEEDKCSSIPMQTRDYYGAQTCCRLIVSIGVELVGSLRNEMPPGNVRDGGFVVARNPGGITINIRTGQIYVTDRMYHVVLVFSANGQYQFQFGGPGPQLGQFNRPSGIVYDVVSDRIIIVDKDNHRVQIFTTAGHFLSAFGREGNDPRICFSYPWGVAVSRNNQSLIAISEAGNRRIQIFTKDGGYLGQFGAFPVKETGDSTIYAFPRGVAFDPTGWSLYISDYNLHSVYRLDLGPNHLVTLVSNRRLLYPSGIDVDSRGKIIVCDTRRNVLKVFSRGGRLLSQLSNIEGSSFVAPRDLTVTRSGLIAILDLKGRVRVFSTLFSDVVV